MQRYAIASVLAGMAAWLVSGCGPIQMPPQEPKPAAAPPPAGGASYMGRTAVRADPQTGGESIVDTALVWAQKYAEASDRIAVLQQENRDLAQRSQKLSEQVAKLQAELAQAQKELGEANGMLVDIRGELERWKTNVLGFRQEMRQAQQAQLKALANILRLVGGETPDVLPAATTQPIAEKEIAGVPSH